MAKFDAFTKKFGIGILVLWSLVFLAVLLFPGSDLNIFDGIIIIGTGIYLNVVVWKVLLKALLGYYDED